MRTIAILLLCAPLALATKIIDGDDPPDACFDWNETTKTATLLFDITEPIEITGDGVTLDGDNHLITGSGSGVGVTVGVG